LDFGLLANDADRADGRGPSSFGTTVTPAAFCREKIRGLCGVSDITQLASASRNALAGLAREEDMAMFDSLIDAVAASLGSDRTRGPSSARVSQ
jgi:hypothetical protein